MKTIFQNLTLVFLCLMWAYSGTLLRAQNTYNMQNLTVNDCEGILLHSEAGENGNYDHNEDFTFIICIPGANEIILSFDYFATEQNYDVMTIYDGPDRMSPIIATLSGIRQPPPTFVATSGCVTIHFRSDDNITANGWRMRWRTQINAPVIPNLRLVSTVVCPLNEAVFEFTSPIGCDQIVPGNFNLVGPGGSSIGSIVVLDCANGMATRFRVVFNPPLASPANFRLLFSGVIYDACGNQHPVNTNVLFQVANCPIQVSIRLINGAACVGQCAQMEAVPIADNLQNLSYTWSPGGGNTRIINVCNTIPTQYSVTVTDTQTGRTSSAVFLYEPLENPIILNPIQDTVCASAANRTLQTNMPGGEFYSGLIPDHHRTSGVYEFWRWSSGNNLRVDTVTYIAPNGCRVRDTVHIWPINAGSIQASCLNAPPFQMNGGTPAGGAWSGPHLSPDGIFNPVENGAFWATYTAPNGCAARKRVHVYDSIIMPVVDTLCTTEVFFLEATPPGGRWSGPGVVNNINGRLEAWRPTPNQWHTYTYTMNGCEKSIEIYINALWAGPDIELCASESRLQLPWPGNWSGPGVYIPAENAFDISGLVPGEYTYTLTQSICQDDFTLYLREITATVDDQWYFCLEDQPFNVADYVEVFPAGGSFSGAGITEENPLYWFNPIQVGPGRHWFYYEVLGCRDSAQFVVAEPATFPRFEFCERSIPTLLTANPPGGTWSGIGFLDEESGLFDPQLPGLGTFDIYYTAPNGCMTATQVEISPFEQVRILDIDQQYCFSNQNIPVSVTPLGGQLTINGIVTGPSFNPAQLGSGTFELLYTKGIGACSSSDRRFFQVMPPILKVEATDYDSICTGQRTEIKYSAQGGAGPLTYTWNQGLGFGNSHIVSPLTDSWYKVTISDQCSDPLIDSVFVKVFQGFNVQLRQGPEVCFGDTTFVEILLDPNRYTAIWQSNPPVTGMRYRGLSGLYTVRISENATGCIQEEQVVLPGAGPISANFSLVPNQPCIDIIDNQIEVIDLSFGYSRGFLDYGDGSSPVDLTLPEILRHTYRDTGSYLIRMELFNELGCTAHFERQICVRNMVRIFVPDIFTPNDDLINDQFKIFAFGIKNVKWWIYNRYGGLVFYADSVNATWDGTFKGKPLDPDAYIFVMEYEDQETGEPGLIKKELLLMK